MEPAQRFLSHHHPGDDSAALVFARAIVRPLSLALLPVMVLSLVAALTGASVTVFLYVVFPATIALAALWTDYNLRRIYAEVVILEDRVGARSVWEVLEGRHLKLLPLVDLRRGGTTTTAASGRRVLELEDEDWPHPEALFQALRAARERARAQPLFELDA